MSIFDRIAKLQQKSHAEKNRIALGLSLAITAVVALVWLSLLGVELRSEGTAMASSSGDIIPPLKALTSATADTFNQVKEQANSFFSQEATSGLTH